MLEQAGRFVVGRQENIGKRLVVAHQHVETWPQPLNEIGFQQKRFHLGMGDDEFHMRRLGDHPGCAVATMANTACIVLHPVLQVACLADIKHIAGGIHHPVDTGFLRQMRDEVGNHLWAGLAGCLGHFLPHYIARIARLGAIGFRCGVYGFGRVGHDGNIVAADRRFYSFTSWSPCIPSQMLTTIKSDHLTCDGFGFDEIKDSADEFGEIGHVFQKQCVDLILKALLRLA